MGGRSYISYNKVPAKLEEFCRNLNVSRQQASKMSVDELYSLTFDAHYNLVTIHPWADGKQSAASLAQKLGISAKAVEKQLAKLKSDGVIERKGPAKGGEWIVK